MGKKDVKKAVSQSQRNLFGWAYACAKDDSNKKDCPENITKLGKKFKEKYPEDLKSMAKTKHKGLPKKKKNEMKWIKSREKIFEDKEQLYDGTWGDTFIGQLFGWVGRKLTSKVSSMKIGKLVDRLNNEVNFKPLEEIAKEDQEILLATPYIKILELKDYVNSEEHFNKKVFNEMLDDSIRYHEEMITKDYVLNNNNVLKAHKAILENFKNVSSEIESIKERILLESNIDDDPAFRINDILIHFKKKPIIPGKEDTLMTVNIGTEGRFKEYKDSLKNVIEELQKTLKSVDFKKSKIIDNDVKKDINNFIEYLYPATQGGKMNWDNHGALRASLVKIQKDIENILQKIQSQFQNIDKSEQEKTESFLRKLENKIGPIVQIQWTDKKGKLKKGYSTEEWLDFIEDNYIIKNVKLTDKHNIFTKLDSGIRPSENMIKNIIQIDDIRIRQKDDDKFRLKAKRLLDSYFKKDEEYKKIVNKANEKEQSIKAKSGDFVKEVDPIEILKIFNTAYDIYTISKEEYNEFDRRFSSKVANRKKRQYRIKGDVAVNRKMFSKWNESVLDWLKNNPELDKRIKKFVIQVLDNPSMFGSNIGLQASLLSEIFGIKLDEPIVSKQKKRYGGTSLDVSTGSSKIYAEFSKDSNGEFKLSEKNEIQLLKKNFERVPFAFEDENNNFYFFVMLNIDEDKIINKMGFNYMEWLKRYDSVQLGDISINKEPVVNVFISWFDLPEGATRSVRTGDNIKINYLTIENIDNNETVEPKEGTIKIKNLYILSGKEDGKMYQIKSPREDRIEEPDKYIKSVGELTNKVRKL